MKKYNLSSIMKAAWVRFKKFNAPYNGKIVHTFSECLKDAWAEAKKAARVFTGIVRNVQVAGTMMHPVLVNVDMDTLTVTGNTFPVRKLMRELGLDWDKETKDWTGTRETLNALCVKYV